MKDIKNTDLRNRLTIVYDMCEHWYFIIQSDIVKFYKDSLKYEINVPKHIVNKLSDYDIVEILQANTEHSV